MGAPNRMETALFAMVVAGLALGAGGAGAAKAATIGSFGELLAPGYTSQGLVNTQVMTQVWDFRVDGQIPTLDYKFGLLDLNGYVVGYIGNSHPIFRDLLSGAYNGDPASRYDNVMKVGEKPYGVIVIEDTDEDGIIADLTGGNLMIDSGDRFWLTNDIEFNGVAGAISEMPAYTGTSDTLTIPAINLVPEPAVLSLMAFAAVGLFRRQSRLRHLQYRKK